MVAQKRLVLADRVRIEAWWAAGWTFARIGAGLGRDPSVIYREVARNHSARHGTKNPLGAARRGLYRWGYRAEWAQARAIRHARRPKPARLTRPGLLRTVVVGCLRQRWSPEQVANRLRRDFPDRPEMWVSHETIYQALYLQSRGNLRAELTRQVALRSGRASRRPQRQAAGAARSRRPWAEGLHLSTRPPEAIDRAVPGHWEGDLVIGAGGHSAIVTLVERAHRYVMLGALPDGRVSEQVIDVLSTLIGRLPAQLRRSLTWDLGSELADHPRFTIATRCPVYFCDPHSPWQRGSNENTNGLLRQYFPKGVTDFRTVTQAQLDAVAIALNGRPRKTLGWDTPAEALEKYLHALAS
jgi:IS30 family transposase